MNALSILDYPFMADPFIYNVTSIRGELICTAANQLRAHEIAMALNAAHAPAKSDAMFVSVGLSK